MGHKYRITNTSNAPRFLAERGKLLQPGESTTASRVDAGTKTVGWWQVEEGDFHPTKPMAKVTTEKQRYDEDDEDDKPATKEQAVVEDGPAALVDAKRQSRVIPLEAPADEDEEEGELEEDEGESLAKDELDGEVAKAVSPADAPTKADKEESAGFVDRRPGGSSDDPLVGR